MHGAKRPTAGALAALVLAATSGCGPDASRPSDFVVRDSAGVRIVEHADGPFSDTVGPEPLLAIGREGEPDYELFRVRAVLGLASGNVVVANGGTTELRFYGPDGRHVRTMGRRGEGPGEIGFLSTAWLGAADTVVVLDTRRRRLVLFDSAGAYARGESFADAVETEPPADATGMCAAPGLLGVLADGARITRRWGCMEIRGSAGPRPTPTELVLVREEAATELGVFDLGGMWERADPPTPRERMTLIPFGAVPSWATGPERFYLSEGRSHEVRAFDADGRLDLLIREVAVSPAVPAEDRAAFRALWEERGRPHPDDVPFPEHTGAYDRMRLSDSGEVWVRRYASPQAAWHRWVVFSADGERLRRVVLPAVDVRSIRAGSVYATLRDELGIESVRVYAVGETEPS